MRVLVTGATGFVGSAAVRALRRHGHAVWGLVRDPAKAPPLTAIGAEVFAGDMWRPETYVPRVSEVDAVIHAAQQRTTGRWTRAKIHAMHESDTRMTRSLAAACLAEQKPFVYTSGALTHARYGGARVDESMPARPCLLARGHAEMEAELVSLARTRGLRATIISPGFVYGAGGILETMARLMRRGQYRLIGPADNRWSLVHIDDLGEAYALVLEHGRPGEAYFLGDDHPLSRREVVHRLAAVLDTPAPKAVPRLLAQLLFGRPLVEAITAPLYISNEKAKRELHWQPSHVNYADSLPAVVAGMDV
ncbi:MAG: NAD-dependent epimerase/dehydratase family protein [Pirellulales bacterium]|nr:NAD-dependent epimerase/dehydratase family protein [Pirellulales bacterium]